MYLRPLVRVVFVQKCFLSTAAGGSVSKGPTLWYHASDVPLTKPYDSKYKPSKPAEKFVKFSASDCRRLEGAFQKWSKSQKETKELTSVPVNEDFLFEVNIPKMVLKPTYWRGPTYEVRRGIWMNANNNPLAYELTAEIERFYAKMDSSLEGDKEQEKQDLFRFTQPYGKHRMVLFVDKTTAYLLPDLKGGELQLKLLRTNLIPPMGDKITRGSSSNHLTDAAASAKRTIENEIQGTTKQLGKLSDLISWELPSVFGMPDSKDSTKGNDDDSDVFKREIETDYDNDATTPQRDVKHLVLCVHGIGQNLGKKYEYVNFAHTVNILRTNMKKLYMESGKLQKMNRGDGSSDWRENCNVQVLPISWRHTVGFQTDATQPNKENPELPPLGDITLNGVLGLRRLLGDIALDILLYGEPYYRKRILDEVKKHLNDTYNLFKERNPGFGGEVHLIGHSLGSLILFDILCEQDDFKLDFDVKNFYSIGSPTGVFKLIQRTKIGSKQDEPEETSTSFQKPKCENLYNLFHVCDPISYRMEPLIELSMAQYQAANISHWSAGDGIASRVLEFGGSILKDIPGTAIKGQKPGNGKTMLPVDVVEKLTKLNRTGRIDYMLPPGFLEVDIIAAAKAHVSYFEEPDIAGFILKEILAKNHGNHDVIVTKLNRSSDA